jgi:hypothetical protein
MAVLISVFYPGIYDFVKGIELAQYATTLAGACVDGIRRFCIDTGIWQKTLSPITVTSPTSTYALSLPTDSDDGKADLVHVEWAKFRLTSESDDQYVHLIPRTRQYMDHYYGPAWEFQIGRPTIFVVEEPQTIRLYPIPDSSSGGSLLARVALMPTLDATKTIDFLYNKYQNVIQHAILSEIYGYTNKPWSDQELSKASFEDYTRDLYIAKTFVQAGINKPNNSPFWPPAGGSRNSDGSW